MGQKDCGTGNDSSWLQARLDTRRSGSKSLESQFQRLGCCFSTDTDGQQEWRGVERGGKDICRCTLPGVQHPAGAEGSTGVSSLVEAEEAIPETQVWSLGMVGGGGGGSVWDMLSFRLGQKTRLF